MNIRALRNWAIFVLLIFIALIIYFNSLSNTFHFDDRHHIVNNPSIRDILNIPRYFWDTHTFSEKPEVAHYRPLLLVTYALNYSLGGLDPEGYHLVNLGFHVGSAFLVFLIVQAMLGNTPTPSTSLRTGLSLSRYSIMGGGKKGGGTFASTYFTAIAAGLIFLVHPFNSEVVNYITARSTVMCSFFYLLAFYCWVNYRSQKSEVRSQNKSYFLPRTSYFYITSILAFLAAMLTKEIAITFPILIYLYDRYLHPSPEVRQSLFKSFSSYIPFVLLVLLPFLIIRVLLWEKGLSQLVRPLWSQFNTGLVVLLYYIKLILFPIGLSVYHDLPVYDNPWHLPVLFSGALIFFILAGAIIIWFRGERPEWSLIAFLIFWFFITLLPTTIIPLNAILQENRAYLASVTFATIAGVGIEKLQSKYPRLSVIFLITLLLFYSVITFQRNTIWKEEISLWSDAAAQYPRSETAHINLSMAYRENGMIDESIKHLKKVISMNPENFQAHFNLGWIYRERGLVSNALMELERAAEIRPSDAYLHNDIGALYYTQRMFAQSERHLLKSIKLDRRYIQPRYNLGLLYMNQGKRDEATRQFMGVISLDPDNRVAKEMLTRLTGQMNLQ